MTTETDIPSLNNLAEIPYVDENGQLPERLQGKVGVYAIFDREKVMQFVGYSRDVYLSLKQHLVRQMQYCYWIKVQTIERPNRTILENIQNAWMAENAGIQVQGENWTQAIDVRSLMTVEEKADYEKAAGDELAESKVLKNVARRVETEILERLKLRGIQAEIRFNSKLKEKGLLDLK